VFKDINIMPGILWLIILFYRSLSGKIMNMDGNVIIRIALMLGFAAALLAILFIRETKLRRKIIQAQKAIADHNQIQESLREQIRVMSKISRGFLMADDERTIIELVLEFAMKITGAAGVSFVPINERGQPTGVIRQGDFPFPLPEAWLEYLATPSIRQQCNNCKNHGSMMKVCPLLKGPFSQAAGLYCLPLRRGEQDLGVLNLYLPSSSGISLETKDFLSSLVDETSLALEGVRFRKRELAAINELNTVRQKTDLKEILANLLISFRSILEADYVILAIKGIGIDGLSEKVLNDQMLYVGDKLTDKERISVGNVLQQVYSLGKGAVSEELPIEHSKGSSDDTLIVEPLQLNDQITVGVIAAGKRGGKLFDKHQKSLFPTMANQLTLLVENTQSAIDMQYKAMIEERGRLAREIHDGLAQTLGFLKLQTAQMQNSLEKNDLERLQFFLKASYSALAEAYQDAREAIDGLRLIGIKTGDEIPLHLGDVIVRVLQEYSENNMLNNVNIHLQCADELTELAPEIIVQLIRIIQEALSNIRKHSNATQVWINTWENSKDLVLEVKDDGNGFPAEDISETSKHGLVVMQERAELIGADFQVVSRAGEGTQVVVRLPLVKRRKMEI
jgi:two-component system nitrate/nitrite sensor histidine kinase NarX